MIVGSKFLVIVNLLVSYFGVYDRIVLINDGLKIIVNVIGMFVVVVVKNMLNICILVIIL